VTFGCWTAWLNLTWSRLEREICMLGRLASNWIY